LLNGAVKARYVVSKILIPAVIIVAIGWVAFGIWKIKIHLDDKNKPKRTTKHLQKVKDSFEEYTKKMEKQKLKPYERE